MSANNRSNTTDDSAQIEISRLSAENKRLRRELEELKAEMTELKGKNVYLHRADFYHRTLRHRADTEYMFSKKNFFSFLLAKLKCTSVFHIYKRIINALRRYSFITTSLKVFSVIFLFIEASLLVLVSTSAFIVSLVFTLFISHIFTILTVFARRKRLMQNAELLKGKSITIFFPPKERAFDHGSFFSSMVREEAKRDSTAVIIVSPYIFNSTGLDRSKARYFFSREDGSNVVLVRRSFYFKLRKKVIVNTSSVKEIY